MFFLNIFSGDVSFFWDPEKKEVPGLRIFPEIRRFRIASELVVELPHVSMVDGHINLALDWYAHLRWHLRTYHVDKTIINHPFGIISEWFIPLYGDLGDGLLLFEPH